MGATSLIYQRSRRIVLTGRRPSAVPPGAAVFLELSWSQGGSRHPGGPDRSTGWCSTSEGTAIRGAIDRAYRLAEAAGIPVWCQDEAGPYQAIPQAGAGWAPEFLRELDLAFKSFGRTDPYLKAMTLKPSEQIRRAVKFTPFPGEDVGRMREAFRMAEPLRDLRQRHALQQHTALPMLERRIVHIDGHAATRDVELTSRKCGSHAGAVAIVIGRPGWCGLQIVDAASAFDRVY